MVRAARRRRRRQSGVLNDLTPQQWDAVLAALAGGDPLTAALG